MDEPKPKFKSWRLWLLSTDLFLLFMQIVLTVADIYRC